MPVEIIDGENIAEQVLQELEEKNLDRTPKMQIIFVGNNPASETYIEEKKDFCKRLGFKVEVKSFQEDVNQSQVLEEIKAANNDSKIDGILVQLPLPKHIDNNSVFETLSAKKDVDCLTPENLGKVLRGNSWIKPCAVEGVERILEAQETDLAGKNAVIVNNSNLIGKPLSMTLTGKDATVTICHEETENLKAYTEDADIVVTATGEKEIIRDEMISEDSIVIDAGYSYSNGNVAQETDELEKPSKLSTVPGGLGPVTVAMTMKNLVKCFERQN